MIIENLDSLKVWLVKKLEPICDADPSALAKYVIALAKKDKSECELRALCEDQLDVFLGDETKLFVTELFDTLQTKEYAPPTESIAGSEKGGIKRKSFEESEKSEVEKVQKTENKADVGKISENDKENSKESKPRNKLATDVLEGRRNSNESSISMGDTSNKTIERVKSASRLDAEVKNDDVNMRGASQDRSMKSMSPAVRSRQGHSSRRKSPRSPIRSGSRHSRSSRRDRPRREHRDGSRERRQRRRKKEKCRDYEEKGICMLGEVCPYDHGYDPVEVDDRNLPQMLSLAGLPSSQPNSTQLQTAPALQLLQPNVMPQRPMLHAINSGLSLNPGLTTVHVQRPRPIPSPVELPGSQVPIFRPRNPAAFMQNISPPITPLPDQLVPTTTAETAKVTPAPVAVSGEPYNPEEPSIEVEEADVQKKDETDTSSQTSTEKDLKTDSNTEKDTRSQDELVQIAMGNIPLRPIVGSQPNNLFHLRGGMMQHPQQQVMPTQSSFTNAYQPNLNQHTYLPMAINSQQQYHQLQFQQQQAAMLAAQNLQQQQQQQTVVQVQSSQPTHRRNTVLEIRKIPRELNNIMKLSEHFQKFGTITKLQAPFQQDPQGALLEFATYQSATAAYNSPEAILGNRFIKMFWHNPNRNQKNTQQGNSNLGVNSNQGATVGSTEVSQQNEVDLKPKKIASSEELRYRNPKSDPKLVQMEKKKQLDKLKIELMKKKQTHYDELIKKQKGILTKLQDKNLSKDDKNRLLKAFKHCDTAVQKLKKELIEDATPKPQPQQLSSVPSKQYRDYKKEILDKEIDIYHGNLEGDELVEAKKALDLLKREQSAQTGGRGRGYHRGRGRGRGSWYRGRGGRGRGAFQSSTVDNRPKQILVTGYNAVEKDDVLTHFAAFGCLDRVEETASDKVILTFPTRKAAEIAAIQGTDFRGKQLALAWFTGQMKTAHTAAENQTIQRRMTRSLSQSLMEKDMDDELLELDKDEEELLLAGVDDDEDEEMESDERSWRR